MLIIVVNRKRLRRYDEKCPAGEAIVVFQSSPHIHAHELQKAHAIKRIVTKLANVVQGPTDYEPDLNDHLQFLGHLKPIDSIAA